MKSIQVKAECDLCGYNATEEEVSFQTFTEVTLKTLEGLEMELDLCGSCTEPMMMVSRSKPPAGTPRASYKTKTGFKLEEAPTPAWVCQVAGCGKSFNTKRGLNKHIQVKHNDGEKLA